jgi:LIVCS family branched-chain amino acid:cation transporter
MASKPNSGVIAAGFALFSMFFGAGDLIWPLILGGDAGNQNLFAMLGLLITGVSLPLLGLIAMMLFEGNYRAFFGRIGGKSSLILIFIIQVVLGPIGTIPRSITLSYATLKPYLPEDISLLAFSLIACVVILAFTLRPQKVIDILGLVLTPILLLAMGAILVLGIYHHPEPHAVEMADQESFVYGLKVGYNTLDLIASFVFAPLVMSHFIGKKGNKAEDKKEVFKKMIKASLLAAGLLSIMYMGLTYVASFYTQMLDPNHHREERLSAISMLLLGPAGSLVSCLAVAMACLTTAIPVVSIGAEYLQKDLLKDKGGTLLPLLIVLIVSTAVANLGFMGIAKMLSPVLQILCPGLIVLSILNIAHKLYETHVPRIPVFATFALSTFGYVI